MLQFWLDFINGLRNKKDESSQMALGRLKGAVSVDRLSLSPATLEQIRGEVIQAISRYLVIDESSMKLAVQAEGRHVALAASIPVLRPRSQPLAASSPSQSLAPNPPSQLLAPNLAVTMAAARPADPPAPARLPQLAPREQQSLNAFPSKAPASAHLDAAEVLGASPSGTAPEGLASPPSGTSEPPERRPLAAASPGDRSRARALRRRRHTRH